MPANHGAIDHKNAAATKHGFVTMHVDDPAKANQARNDVQNQHLGVEADERVNVSPPRDVDGLIVQYVEDVAGRAMDEFHLTLGAIASRYWMLPDPATNTRYFAWTHWF